MNKKAAEIYYPGILMEQLRKTKVIHNRQLLPQNSR